MWGHRHFEQYLTYFTATCVHSDHNDLTHIYLINDWCMNLLKEYSASANFSSLEIDNESRDFIEI